MVAQIIWIGAWWVSQEGDFNTEPELKEKIQSIFRQLSNCDLSYSHQLEVNWTRTCYAPHFSA